MGHPVGAPYVHPQGVHIISRDLLYARVRMPEGQFWPKLSRSRRKFAGTFLAKITGLLRALNPLRGYPFGIFNT